MKAAKNEIAVIVLLSLLVVVSMVVNVYNGTTFYIMRSGESAPYDWNFFGWWTVSFCGAILLFAESQTMYQEKKNGSLIVTGLTALLALFTILLVVI